MSTPASTWRGEVSIFNKPTRAGSVSSSSISRFSHKPSALIAKTNHLRLFMLSIARQVLPGVAKLSLLIA